MAFGATSVAPLDPTAAGIAGALVLVGTAASASDTPVPREPIATILIVDNDPVLRMLLSKFLTFVGYRVLEARLGSEAMKLARLHSDPIDLLLTDVVMPGMNGFELAQAFVECHPEARILYMSGHVYDVSEVATAARANPEAFMIKPFWAEQLLERIQHVLPDSNPGPPS